MTLYKQGKGNVSKEVRVVNRDGFFEVSVDGDEYFVSMVDYDAGTLSFALHGRQYHIPVIEENGHYYVAIEGRTYRLETSDNRRSAQPEASQSSTVEASMPGTISNVFVSVGDVVQKGTPVILMEAMKMEMRLVSPRDGTIKTVHVVAGQLVRQSEILLELT